MWSSQPKKQVSRFFTIVIIRHIVHNTVEFRKSLQFSEFGFSLMRWRGLMSIDVKSHNFLAEDLGSFLSSPSLDQFMCCRLNRCRFPKEQKYKNTSVTANEVQPGSRERASCLEQGRWLYSCHRWRCWAIWARFEHCAWTRRLSGWRKVTATRSYKGGWAVPVEPHNGIGLICTSVNDTSSGINSLIPQ